ncbi:MAG: hypothetical protein HOO96_41130 [Polyangiaceae bacterium]|nr:hypothetical protein [Polyangiaceae bacterium]
MPDAAIALAPEEPPNASELVFFALCTVAAVPASYLLARKTWRRDWGSAVVEVPVEGGGAYRAGRVTERRQLPVPRLVGAAAFLSFFVAAAIPLVGYPFVFDLGVHFHPRPWWVDPLATAGVCAVPVTFLMGLLLRQHAGRYASEVMAVLVLGATIVAARVTPWTSGLPFSDYHLVTMSALTATLAVYTLSLVGAAVAFARKPAAVMTEEEAVAEVPATQVRIGETFPSDSTDEEDEEGRRARR